MYNEKTFLNYIFWTKVKRVFIILAFSIAGCFLGIFISDMVQTLTLSDESRVKIISISTIIFFLISLLITLNTSREIQNAYWKVAVLRKLTVMSKKLDNLDSSVNLEDLKEELTNIDLIENNIEKKPEETKIKDENNVENKSKIQQEVENEETLEEIINSEELKKSKRTIAKIKTI